MRLGTILLACVLAAGCTAPENAPAARQDDLSPLSDDASTNAPTPSPASPTASPSPPTAAPATPAPRPTPSPAPSNGTEPEPDPGANGSDPRRPFEPEEAAAFCDSLAIRSPLTADPEGLVGGWETLSLDVVMLADATFVAEHPTDWDASLRDLVADASAQYERQLGLRLEPILVESLPAEAVPLGGTAESFHAIARGWMVTQHPGVAFDYVALILGSDVAGTTAGMVECVGGAESPDTAYLWSEWDRDRAAGEIVVGLMEDIPLKTFMHESAHLLGAHHHYSDCGEPAVEYSTSDAVAVCDVMINDVGLASYRFSPTNRLVVRSFVEEHGLGEPAG